MDREILFRGEWTETGDWVKGHYVRLFDDKGNRHHRIYPGYAESDCGDLYPDWYEVDPETVGQFTGLTDKNGKKIFEGDIIEHHVQGDILVNRGVVVWIESEARFAYRLRTMEPGFYMHKPETVEVIGNIHDNPELLEGGV